MIAWRVVPLQHWPGKQTRNRKRHNFRSTAARARGDGTGYDYSRRAIPFAETTALLERELGHLRARNVLLQLAVTPGDIRQDGWIRATARLSHPGVILTFHSDVLKKPLSYPCDTFEDWQANVRAIAKSLEWLRGVDRYGVTMNGEQYQGFAQLPPAGGTQENRPEIVQRGRELIGQYGGATAALHATHPDKGGNLEDFLAVQAARGKP